MLSINRCHTISQSSQQIIQRFARKFYVNDCAISWDNVVCCYQVKQTVLQQLSVYVSSLVPVAFKSKFKILILMCKYCISSCVCGHTVCLRTLGNQAFEAVGSEQWNALPASPRFTVHKYIKPELVHKHYPNACLSRHVFRKDVYVLAFDLLSSLVLFIL